MARENGRGSGYTPNSNTIQVFSYGVLGISENQERDYIKKNLLKDQGLQILDYLEDTGDGGFFDTGYIPSVNSTIDFTYSPVILNGGNYTFGESYNFSDISDTLLYSSTSSEVTGEKRTQGEKYRNIIKSGSQKSIESERAVVYSEKTTFSKTYTVETVKFLVDNPDEASGDIGIRFYAAYIEENGEQIHNYVPVKITSTGETGLYDLVEGKILKKTLIK